MIVRHLAQWGEGLYQTEKELLLLAIGKKSHLVFDIIHWVVQVTIIFLAVSTAKCCDEHSSDELKKHAKQLINIFYYIPDSKEAINVVENCNLTEQIFTAAIEAYRYNCEEEALEISELLLLWAVKGEKQQTGWGILGKACCGLACLNIILKLEYVDLLEKIEEEIRKNDWLTFGIKNRIASTIRRESEKINQVDYSFDLIDSMMRQIDKNKLRELVDKILDLLLKEDIQKSDLD